MPPINNVWANNTPSTTGEEAELTLPSGQTCRARKIGMEGMLAAGLINEADTLSSLVDFKHIRKVRGAKGRPDGEELDTKSLLKDPKALLSLMGMADRALPLIVVSPTVVLNRDENGVVIPLEDRDPDKVYTDQIDVLDKFELFGWAMGEQAGLQSFRGKPAANNVAGVVHGEGVPRKTERNPRRRR